MQYIAYVDGGCNNFLHKNAYGSYSIFNIRGDSIESGSMIFDSYIATSNKAEYATLLEALKIAIDIDKSGQFKFISDSKLMVNQLNKVWRVRDKQLVYLNTRILELSRRLQGFEVEWTPRKNIVAILGH